MCVSKCGIFLLSYVPLLISAPGAWAHAPLEKRLHDLKVPVTFIYGASDWMKPEHAVKVRRFMASVRLIMKR